MAPGVRAVQYANPQVEFEGRKYLFVANQLANLDAQRLGPPLGKLPAYREQMIAAIDFMIVGF
jgi:toxin CcdB